MFLNFCPNDECKNIIDRNEQYCSNCGSMLNETRIENDPFHFQYTQVEKHYEERDDFMAQIQKYEKMISPIFEWLTQEDLQIIQDTCVDLLYKHGLQKRKNQVRNLIAAILFDLIRKKNNISQADDIRKMMSELNVKSKNLLFYLQFVTSSPTGIKVAFQEQIKNFEDEIKKYLLSSGSSILFQIKHHQNKQTKYSVLVNNLLESLKTLLENLYALDVVRQFCVSKKPSRWVISLGYTALQILQIYVMPIEYSKIFNINLSTLKFFTSGLRTVLSNEINRYKSQETTSASIDNHRTVFNHIDNEDYESFSDISFKPCKKLKGEKFDLSESTFDFPEDLSKEPLTSNIVAIKHYKIIAGFFEKDIQNYLQVQEKFQNALPDNTELQDIEIDILELQDILRL